MTPIRTLAPVVFLAVSVSGCTLVGLGIGAAVDGRERWTHGKRHALPPLQLVHLDRGKKVELVLRSGETVRGDFVALEPVPDTVYAARWQESLQALAGEIALPPLRSAVRLRRADRDAEGELLGCEFSSIAFADAAGRTQLVPLDSVVALEFAGGVALDAKALGGLVSQGRVPQRRAIAVDFADGSRKLVRLEEVASASIVGKGSRGRLTGLVVGALIDAVILVAATDSDPAPACRPDDPNCVSCPFVYSHDGRGFVLDAEPLGASLFAADEARDRVPLRHLVAQDGSYRLRIRNEMREIEHIDVVRLLTIDHAPGTEVVPDMQGRLLATADAVAPRRAADWRGTRLEQVLAAEDRREWLGVPLSRGPGDERERIELEFPRPRGAAAATLVFSVRATAWGTGVFAHVLGLQGRGLEGFWARLERDAGARQALREAWAREALPRVSVWTGREWRHSGTLAHIPVAVVGRRALALDLRGIEHEALRVRIESMPGLWAFDRVVADFGPAPSLGVTTLSPRSARTETQADVLPRLALSDDARVTLASMSGWVDVTFDAPVPAPALERSFVLELEGHYRPLLPADGEPQTALFDRLVHEPGALTRYVLDGAEAQTRLALADAGRGGGR